MSKILLTLFCTRKLIGGGGGIRRDEEKLRNLFIWFLFSFYFKVYEMAVE
jgi:hypothetical protein